MSDPYVYPHSDVLINRAGLRDPERAAQLERIKSQERYRQLVSAIERGELAVAMTPESYRSLHRAVFQDVYDWAGQIRTVNIAKKDLFCLAPFVEKSLEERFALIRAENGLKGLSPAKFAERAADHITEINAIHPFREGNGRVQRLFLKALAHQAGHRLVLTRITPDAWHRASLEGFHGDQRAMCAVISQALTGMIQAKGQARGSAAEARGTATEGEAPEKLESSGWKDRATKLSPERSRTRRRGRKRSL